MLDHILVVYHTLVGDDIGQWTFGLGSPCNDLIAINI